MTSWRLAIEYAIYADPDLSIMRSEQMKTQTTQSMPPNQTISQLFNFVKLGRGTPKTKRINTPAEQTH